MGRPPAKELTERELEVMQTFWKHGEATAAEVKEAAAAIAEKLTAVEDALVQTKSRSFEDPLNYPGKIYAQLAHLQDSVNGSFGALLDARPTNGARQRFADLQAQIEAVYADLQQILHADIPAFNEQVGGLDLPAVIVRMPSQE